MARIVPLMHFRSKRKGKEGGGEKGFRVLSIVLYIQPNLRYEAPQERWNPEVER